MKKEVNLNSESYAGIVDKAIGIEQAFEYIEEQMAVEAELRHMVDEWFCKKYGNEGLEPANKMFAVLQRVLYPHTAQQQYKGVYVKVAVEDELPPLQDARVICFFKGGQVEVCAFWNENQRTLKMNTYKITHWLKPL